MRTWRTNDSGFASLGRVKINDDDVSNRRRHRTFPNGSTVAVTRGEVVGDWMRVEETNPQPRLLERVR